MIAVLIVCTAVGLLCIRSGVLLWKRQRIGLLHDYHTDAVWDGDIPDYTRGMGLGMILIGAGILLTGMICFAFDTPAGGLCLPAGLAAGLPLMLRAQKRYGGR
ncbi:MAG: DUF3784 domain-containing protein [Oscillospiraceae bacterium]|nr:DUF3784 domain-containing protein [Oscillospiraceae bacterium]